MDNQWLRPKHGALYAGVSLRTFNEWFTIGLKRAKVRGVTVTKREWIDSFLINNNNQKIKEDKVETNIQYEEDRYLKETVPVFGRENIRISRAKKYKWKQVVDKLPEFIWAHKTNLLIDDACRNYQRTINENKVLRIAKEWTWAACGALTIAEHPTREDKYIIIDGQHRKSAADLLDKIDFLPCLLFEMISEKEQADKFLRINTMRAGLTSFEKYKAKLVRGDESILGMKAMVEKTGHRLANGDGEKDVRCIAAIENSWNIDEELTKKLWPIVVYIMNNEQVHRDIWTGVFYLSQKHDIIKYASKLRKAGKEKILKKIAESKALFGKGGIKQNAYGILAIINHGLKDKNRLSIN